MKKTTTKLKRSDDLYIEIPEDWGFEPGDEFEVALQEDGSLLLTKITYEQISLDLPDGMFMKLATKAHNRNITFNELVVELIKEMIEE